MHDKRKSNRKRHICMWIIGCITGTCYARSACNIYTWNVLLKIGWPCMHGLVGKKF